MYPIEDTPSSPSSLGQKIVGQISPADKNPPYEKTTVEQKAPGQKKIRTNCFRIKNILGIFFSQNVLNRMKKNSIKIRAKKVFLLQIYWLFSHMFQMILKRKKIVKKIIPRKNNWGKKDCQQLFCVRGLNPTKPLSSWGPFPRFMVGFPHGSWGAFLRTPNPRILRD